MNVLAKYLEYSKLSSEEIISFKDELATDDLVHFICFAMEDDFDYFQIEGVRCLNEIALNRIWRKFKAREMLSYEDVKVFINNLYKDTINELDLSNVNIRKRFIPSDSMPLDGSCGFTLTMISKDNFDIYYSKDLLDDLSSGLFDFEAFINRLSIITHELIHVSQDVEVLRKVDLNLFIISLEWFACREISDY